MDASGGTGGLGRSKPSLSVPVHRPQVIRNDKDCLDAGIGEVRVLTALAKLDPEAKLARLQLVDYFYHREHLFIVTNVLRDSLCAFYKHLAATHPSSGEHEHGDSPGVIAPWYRMRRQRVRQCVGHGM